MKGYMCRVSFVLFRFSEYRTQNFTRIAFERFSSARLCLETSAWMVALLATLFPTTELMAQSPQVGPYYFYYPIHSPAFTGASYGSKLVLGLRSMYPNAQTSFTSYYAGFDQFITKVRSGFGGYILNDATNQLRTTEAAFQYSYRLPVSKNSAFQFGSRTGFGQRLLSAPSLSFMDQYNDVLVPDKESSDPFSLAGEKSTYFIAGLGAIFYNGDWFMGMSFSHLNQPLISLPGVENDYRMPTLQSYQLGYRYVFNPPISGYPDHNEESITPILHYQAQGGFQQFTTGAYLRTHDIHFGLFYKGPLWANYNNLGFRNDGILTQLGIYYHSFTMAYLFELPVNGVGLNTGGIHEITVQIHIRNQRTLTIPKKRWSIPIPGIM